MPTPRRQSLRIVIQHLGEPDRYRLIVYGDAAVYRPLEFTSREATLSALRHLVPGIDENVIPAQNKTVNSGIVFTAEIEVGESQLQGAGLTRS